MYLGDCAITIVYRHEPDQLIRGNRPFNEVQRALATCC